MESWSHRVCSICIDVLSLEAVAVSCCRYDPNEWDTTCVDTCTSANDKVAVLENIPVETDTWRHVQTSLRHVCSRKTLERCACSSLLSELLVEVTCDFRIERHLETDTGSKLEVVAECELILEISRSLHILEAWINLLEVVTVCVSDSESYRSTLSLEIFP